MSKKTKERTKWLNSRPELGRLRAAGGLTRSVLVDGASIAKWCTRVGVSFMDVVEQIVEAADASDRRVILVTSQTIPVQPPHLIVASELTVASLLHGRAIGEVVTPASASDRTLWSGGYESKGAQPSVPSVLCADVSRDPQLLDAGRVAAHLLDIATGRLWNEGHYDVEYAARQGAADAGGAPLEVESLAKAIAAPRKRDRTYIVTQVQRTGDTIELCRAAVDDGTRREATGHDNVVALLRDVLKPDLVPIMTSSMDVLGALYDAGVPLPPAVEDPALASVLLDPDTRAPPPGVGYIWRTLLGPRQDGTLSFRVDQALDELPSLHAELREELARAALLKLYEEDVSATLPVFAGIEREGFHIDSDELDEDIEHIESAMDTARGVILFGDGANYFADLDCVAAKSEVVAEAIIRCDGKAKAGWRTREPNLERLALSGNPRALAVQDLRSLDSIQRWMKGLDGKTRMRSIFEPRSTGRWYPHAKPSSTIPRHHPRAWLLRWRLVPQPGHVFVAGDFAAIEPRLLAHFSKDPLLVAGAQHGEDIYEHLMPMLQVKEDRDMAKKALLAFMYGQRASQFAFKLPLPEKEGLRIHAALQTALPKAAELCARVQQEALDTAEAFSMKGWRRLQGTTKPQKFARHAFNLKLQGSAADLLRKVLRDLRRVLPSEVKVVHQEFDAVILSCPTAIVDSVKETLKATMENVAQLYVPLVAEVKDGATLALIS